MCIVYRAQLSFLRQIYYEKVYFDILEFRFHNTYKPTWYLKPSWEELKKGGTLPVKMFGPFWSVWCKTALAEVGMSLP